MPRHRHLCGQTQRRRAAAIDSPLLISVSSRESFEFGGTKRMESPGAKQQTLSMANMDTTTHSYLHTELERRRASLQAAAVASVSDSSLHQLITSEHAALARL